MSHKTLRVLLADDHPILLRGLGELLNSERDIEIVGEAIDGVQALDLIHETAPDVAVVDVSMPGLNGIDLARRIGAECPKVRIVLLTGQEDRAYLNQALGIGVSGYVLKRSVIENLVQAIHVVAQNGTYVDPTIAGEALLSIVTFRKNEHKSSLSRLTPREIDVLRLTARGQTNKEIAHELQLSLKTVETFKARAMRKCDLRSRADIVRYVVTQGWFCVDT